MEKTAKEYQKDYTHPELREKLKAQIKAGDKGGHPGEWSARKSQLLNREYRLAGGGFTRKDTLTASQQDLKQWTDEHWETDDHQPAIRGDKTTRYLPHEAWGKLTDAEKAATKSVKEMASQQGYQHVPNTPKVQKKLAQVHKKSKPT